MTMSDIRWPACGVGEIRDGSRVEWSGTMRALVYYGKGRMERVDDRPIVCPEHAVIARVERVHRCGTDVKIYSSGRPDQCEESLFDELRSIFNTRAMQRDGHFTDYTRLLMDGELVDAADDALYAELRQRIATMSPEQRRELSARLRRHWGRILGHETVVVVERVGSRVHELHDGIGYLDGRSLDHRYLDFKVGDRCVLQSRIAYYEPAPKAMPDAAGIQLLGGNITDLAMNLGGAYAELVRLTPEIIQSGSAIRVPAGVPMEMAAMAEPTACLLDCFQKTTHELGQDLHGSILHKSVKPGGVTCVIGSGAMAIMSVMLALLDDDTIGMAPASEVVVIVRSQDKANLVKKIVPDRRVVTLLCPDEIQMTQRIAETYAPEYKQRTGQAFRGFDDVVLCAGSAQTVALAHRIIAPTGARLQTFAGTRGECAIESGVWHYGNAGILGTTGCNTKMLEVSLELFQRGKLPVDRLAGKGYTFDDLSTPEGVKAFFEDKHLRPYLAPNG